MTHSDFVTWLHGYFEIQNPKTIGEKETQIIKDHLDTFFKKITPDKSIEDYLRPENESGMVNPELTTELLKSKLADDCGFKGNMLDTLNHRNTCQICKLKYGLGIVSPIRHHTIITC